MTTTRNVLKYIAASIWITGAVVLFIKSYSLLKQANNFSDSFIPILAMLIFALIAGLLKNKYIMSKFCKKNLDRINMLNEPKIYQFFELKFLFSLVLMILVGAFLSSFAVGNFYALLAVGGLDLSLSTALIMSSVIFFKDK